MRMHNSTIRLKKKQLACGCFGYAFSKNMCQQHATLKRINEQDEAEQDELEKESWTNLRDDCDAILSLVIRHKNSTNGLVKCFTCPKILPISEMTNGHYISRSNMSTRHLEANCRPQCPRCNSRHEEDITPFKNALDAERPRTSEWLEQLGREVYKPSISDLKMTLSELKYKLNLVKRK